MAKNRDTVAQCICITGDSLWFAIRVCQSAKLAPKRRRASPSGTQGNNKGATGRWPALGFNRASVVPKNGRLVHVAESSRFLSLSNVHKCPLADAAP
jgi:hypothetical protein